MQRDAVGEDRDGEAFDVVGGDEGAAFEEREGLGGAVESLCSAGADAQGEGVVGAGFLNDREEVVDQGVVDEDLLNGLLELKDFGLAQERGRRRGLTGTVAAYDFAFAGGVRVANANPHQKPVELRLGEGVGAVVFDGVLRGDHHERLRQRIAAAVDGDLLFIHRFEQGRLGFWGGAVDLVGQKKVCKDSARLELELLGLGVEDGDAENVAGEHVGGELNALESAIDGAGEGVGERGFADAGNVFNQQVAAGEKADQTEANDFRFAAQDRAEVGFELVEAAAQGDREIAGRWRHHRRTPFQTRYPDFVNEEYLRRAIALAEQNVRIGGGPFGAVIVKDGEIVGEGVNRVTANPDPTAHAEVVAIRAAGASLGRHDLSGCEIYASCEPCPMCWGAILWSRMDRIFYAATQSDAAAAGFDDAGFYEELAKPAARRRTPMVAALRDEGARPFAAWREFSGKVRY